MKYNRSEIMKDAWNTFKNPGYYFHPNFKPTFGQCLKMAWAKYKKLAAEKAANEAEFSRLAGKQFENGMEITFDGVTFVLRRWTKGGHDRIYLNGSYGWNSRKSAGFVDIKNRVDYTACGRWCDNAAKAILSMAF